MLWRGNEAERERRGPFMSQEGQRRGAGDSRRTRLQTSGNREEFDERRGGMVAEGEGGGFAKTPRSPALGVRTEVRNAESRHGGVQRRRNPTGL